MNPAPPVTRIRKQHLLWGVGGDSTLKLADWKVHNGRIGARRDVRFVTFCRNALRHRRQSDGLSRHFGAIFAGRQHSKHRVIQCEGEAYDTTPDRPGKNLSRGINLVPLIGVRQMWYGRWAYNVAHSSPRCEGFSPPTTQRLFTSP